MATLRRDRRLPGQSPRYRDHPSNVGSPSYYADTERGWVPNPGASLNKKVNRGGGWEHPVSPTRRSPSNRQPGIGAANRRAGPSFGYDRAGGATNRGSNRQPGLFGSGVSGITASTPGKEFIEEELIEKGSPGAFDHRATAHFKPWLVDMMDKFGGGVQDALRGSRLHKDYKDQYGGSKEWEAAKRNMMTDKDQAFYDKYMNLASMATDNEKAQEYRDTAETAWRNKQTSDRLAAFERFEDYNPGKYSGLGEGSRYTGDVYEGQGRTGEFVPGVGIMDDILDRFYQSEGSQGFQGSDRQPGLFEGEDITVDIGSDRQPGLFEGITEDIAADVAPGAVGGFGNQEMMEMANNPWYGIYPFEKQRQQATFRDAIQRRGDQRDAPRISDPGMVDYPFGENIMDTYRPPEPKAYEGSTLNIPQWFGLGYNPDEEELLQNPGITNPRSAILGG
jgi:hypothetical protein